MPLHWKRGIMSAYDEKALIRDILEKTSGLRMEFVKTDFTALCEYDIVLAKGIQSNYASLLQLEERVLYCIRDMLQVQYVITRHQAPDDCLIILGPFLAKEPTDFLVIDVMTQNHIHPSVKPQLITYYSQLPVLRDSVVRYLAGVIGQYFYGTDVCFSMRELSFQPQPHVPENPFLELPDDFGCRQSLEKRYALQSRLLLEIKSGCRKEAIDTYKHLCQIIASSESTLVFSLNLCRSYSRSLNAMCEKTVYECGVPTAVLHACAMRFAEQIDTAESIEQLHEKNQSMISQYIGLVLYLNLGHYGKYVRSAVEYIFMNLNREISLQELADSVHLTPNYLSSVFKKETGRSVSAFIMEKKLKYACLLLRETTLSVQDIAHHIGYKDLNYFSRIFRREIGMTPTAYRTA